MDLTRTRALADELGAAIAHAIAAHTHFPNTPRDAVRLWDKQTPYVIHPIWCAMTLLTETALSEEIRYSATYGELNIVKLSRAVCHPR